MKLEIEKLTNGFVFNRRVYTKEQKQELLQAITDQLFEREIDTHKNFDKNDPEMSNVDYIVEYDTPTIKLEYVKTTEKIEY